MPEASQTVEILCQNPACRGRMRLPRGGVGTVKCPRCGTSFRADTRDPEAAPQPGLESTSIARSWPRTIKWLLWSLGAGAAALALLVNEHEVWAAIVGLLVFLPGLLMAFTSGSARCLKCGSEFSHEMIPGAFVACSECHTWYRVKGKQVVGVDPDFVSDEPDFAVDENFLKNPLEWRLPRAGRCCVCGLPTLNAIELQSSGEVVSRDWLGHQKVRYARFNVSCCPEHKNGFQFKAGKVAFRSHAYWREFFALNRKPQS